MPGLPRNRITRERGESLLEYLAVLVLIAAMVAAVIIVIPDKVGPAIKSAVCQVLGETGCETGNPGARQTAPAAPPPSQPAAPGAPAQHQPQPVKKDGNDDEGDYECKGNGFQRTFCHAISKPGRPFKGIGLGLGDIASGGWEGATFVACLAHVCTHEGFKSNWGNLKTLFTTNPTETVPTIWKGMTEHCHWNYVDVPRCITGLAGGLVGTKGLNKIGKLKHTPKVPAGRLDELANGAREALSRADKLTREGKLDEAQKAVDDALRKADEAEAEARRRGCKITSLGPPGGGGGGGPPRFGRLGAGVPRAVLYADPEDPRSCGKTPRQLRREAGQRQKAILTPRLRQLGLSQNEIDALFNTIKDGNPAPLKSIEDALDVADPARASYIRNALQPLSNLAGRRVIDQQSLESNLAKIKSIAGTKDYVNSLPALVAEINHAVRVADSGNLAPGSRVYVGGKNQLDLGGGQRMTLPDDVEADVAYVDGNGVQHIDEIKNSMNALINTLRETSEGPNRTQLDKYKAWKDSGGQAKFVVTTTENARKLLETRDEFSRLVASGVSLQIGDKIYDSAALRAAKQRGHF